MQCSIPTSSKDFKQFINISETVFQEYALQDEELGKGFNSLKFNKSQEFDDNLSFLVNFCISGILNISLRTGIPNGIKTVRVSPI